MSTQSITGGGVTHPSAARLAGAALALASLLAIAGFTVLGSVFQYPQILEEPTAEILSLCSASTRARSSPGSWCWSSVRR